MKAQKYVLPLILAIDFCILLFEASSLSLSYAEAHTYFGTHGIVGYLSHIFVPIFGQNDIAVRLPMILLHMASIVLLYEISKEYLHSFRERIILVIVFILLPGVISAALLLNSAGFVIFALLLFIYLFRRLEGSVWLYVYLFLLSFLDNSFAYLYLSLVLYGLYYRKYELSGVSLFSLALNLYIYGTDVGGYPTGHFLDALGVYAAIFSPVVFIYIFYTLYRSYLTRRIDVIWFMATTALLFSLLLSLRQKVHIEYYAPYVIMALPLAARTFVSSYRVRLPRFRGAYRLLFNVSLAFLVFHFVVVLGNKYLYIFLENPKRHFAYDNHIAKELAAALKDEGITCVSTDYKMQLRLEFYGIKRCTRYKLLKYPEKNSKIVTISYMSKPVYTAYVTKVNNK